MNCFKLDQIYFPNHIVVLVQEGLINTFLAAALILYIAAATWLQDWPMPAMHVQWQDLVLPDFSIIILSL